MQKSVSRNLFDIRRDPKLYNYINYLDTHRHYIYTHVSIVIVSTLLYSILITSLQELVYWIGLMSIIIGTIYVMMLAIYIYSLLRSWNQTIKQGLIGFWDLCLQLSIRNYRLLREYKEIYRFHYADVFNKCSDKYDDDHEIRKYVNYVIQNDAANKLEQYEWVQKIVSRIHQYIKLTYLISFLGPDDELDFMNRTIRVNICSDSLLNKRNRKLENTLNDIPEEYRNELIKTWRSINRKDSDRFMIMVPIKWVLYEYRNLFRYLHCAKYFKTIYSSFEKDYTEIEKIVNEIGITVQNLFRRNVIYLPKPFIVTLNTVGDIFVFMLDNLVAINLLSYIYNSGSLFVPLIMGGIFHTIVVCMISALTDMMTEIENPMENCVDLENIDNKIETIFSEMNATLLDGKSDKL